MALIAKRAYYGYLNYLHGYGERLSYNEFIKLDWVKVRLGFAMYLSLIHYGGYKQLLTVGTVLFGFPFWVKIRKHLSNL